jgi:hypothetical protein
LRACSRHRKFEGLCCCSASALCIALKRIDTWRGHNPTFLCNGQYSRAEEDMRRDNYLETVRAIYTNEINDHLINSFLVD